MGLLDTISFLSLLLQPCNLAAGWLKSVVVTCYVVGGRETNVPVY